MTALPLFFLPYHTRDVGSKKDSKTSVSDPNATDTLGCRSHIVLRSFASNVGDRVMTAIGL